MPLTFERFDLNTSSCLHRIWYRDEFGQPRYFEFDGKDSLETRGKALIRQVNELLARPRPAETHCRVREKFPLDKLHPDDVEYIDGQVVLR